jgi:glycosyltransferase involved in cell wall biosynthesis
MRILFCGLSGIPNKKSAPINRYMAIAQAMSVGNEIIFINRFPLYDVITRQIDENEPFKIIDATNCKYRPKSFLKRNLLKVTSFFQEYLLIKKLNKEIKINWLNIYTQFFGICFFYIILSKIFRFKTILHYVEFRSEIKGRSLLFKLNDYLFDHYAVYLCDRILPISSFINNHTLELKPKASTLVIPPICDFEYFDFFEPELSDKKYFVFCGSAGYVGIIQFIIESFLMIQEKNEINLQLVINGKITNQTILQLIEANKDRILIFSGLEYNVLIAKYKGSLAQLIPLRDTIQDCARFPQKICEYLASGRPIVTTNFGEIPHYFIDGKEAVISDEFNTTSFSKKLEWVLENQEKVKVISENSYALGLNLFNTKSYTSRFEKFLEV